MYSLTRTLSRKGQITLPVSVARRYGLHRGGLVALRIVEDDSFAIEPARVAAVRFDSAYHRFSLRLLSSTGERALGVEANLTARRVARLTNDPTAAQRATTEPDTWIPLQS